MYYLQSRYYDPVIGRFISPDKFATTGQSVLGANMFAYCTNDPVNYVDDEGTYALWFILKKTGNFGFVHKCVETEIENNYPGILTEVVIPKYVPYLDRTVNYRADVVEQVTGSVWEIKHAGSDPLLREYVAKFQALHYINGQYDHKKGSGTTTCLGRAGAFWGTFIIAVGTTAYQVNYTTPSEGAILYTITELGNKNAYAYSYSVAYAEEKEKSMSIPTPVMVLPLFVLPSFTFYGSSGCITAIYGGHDRFMKPLSGIS